MKLYDLSTGEIAWQVDIGQRPTAIRYSQDGSVLGVGDDAGTVRIISANNGVTHSSVNNPGNTITDIAFSTDGTRLAVSTDVSRAVRLYSIIGPSYNLSEQWYRNHSLSVKAVAFAGSGSGADVLSAGLDGTVRRWSPTGTPSGIISAHTDEVLAVAVYPDDTLVATAGKDNTIRVFNVTNGQAQQMRTTGSWVTSLAFAPNGDFLVSGDRSGNVRLWSVPAWNNTITVSHPAAVLSVAVSPDSSIIASAGEDSTIRLWSATSGASIGTIGVGVGRYVYSLSFSPDGLELAGADNEGYIRIWRVSDREQLRQYRTEGSGTVYGIALSPNNALLAAGEQSGKVTLWNRLNGTNQTLGNHVGPVHAVAFSPNGAFVISAGDDNTVRYWSLDGSVARALRGHAGAVNAVAATRSGLYIASAGNDAVAMWRVRDQMVNTPPDAPTLFLPEDRQVVPPQPQFDLLTRDAQADRIKFLLELTFEDTGTIRTFETELVNSGVRFTYTLPQELASGNWTWRAKAIDSKGSEGEWSSTRTFLVNRRPLNLQAEAPADNTITAPAPTFQLRAEDPEGDQVRFLIELKQPDTDTIQTFETDLADSGRRLAYTLPQELASGNWTWRAKAIDSKGFESDWSESLRFTVNRVPLSVQVSAPEDNAVTPPTPTFQLQAEDAEGDQVRFILELTQGDTTLQFETDFTDSGRRFTYTLPRELTPGEWQVRAKVVDAKGSESPFSSTRRFVASPDVPGTIPARLTLWSISLSQNGGFTKAQLGLADVPMVRWEPASQQFVQVAPDEPLLPGRAYWLKPSSSVRLQVSGQVASGSLTIPLVAGWNQIGNPFLSEIAWDSSSVRVRRGSEERTLSQATAAGWITGHLWAWQPNPSDPSRGQYVLVSNLPNTRNRLQPWQGYWLYAHEACELILSPTRAGSRSATGEQGNAWLVTLRVHLGKDTAQAHIGACGSASPVSVPMPPDPPMTSCGVRLGCVRNGTLVAADLAPARSMHTGWNLVVQVPPTDQQTATLTWQGVHTAPRDSNLILVDLQTGTRHFLLTTGAYTFAVSPEGGEYRFRIETVPVSRLLHISNVQVRGGRSAGNTYTISYTLSTDARVEVSVLRAGKVVRRLASAGTRAAGVQQITWDGRDSNGIALPNGAYLVEVKASSSDGQVVRHIVPVVLTR